MHRTHATHRALLALSSLALAGCGLDLGLAPPGPSAGDAATIGATPPSDLAVRDFASHDLAGQRSPDLLAWPDLALIHGTPGLAAWYKFDESTGSVIDSSAYHNDGVVEGQGFTRGGPGRAGGCIDFTGASGHVRVPSHTGWRRRNRYCYLCCRKCRRDG